MRMKSFTAPTMAEAMELVRNELGDDAIIVSTQRAAGTKGVRITAALEQADADLVISELLDEVTQSSSAEIIRESLARHGFPQRLSERLVNAVRTSAISDPVLACAAAIEAGFVFAHLPEHAAPRPFMLVGPPGSGKSIAAAKLAARSVLKQRQVTVITCDNIRAGANEQLAAFTRILEIDLVKARGPEALRAAVEAATGLNDLILIDSPGLNPFKQSDMDFLQTLVEAADVEPVLVMAAGGDPAEAGDVAEAFANIGASRLFASRLDTTRRLGSIFAAADAGRMALCDVSASPHVAGGISPISALSLARLMIPEDLPLSPAHPPQSPNTSPVNPHWTDEAAAS